VEVVDLILGVLVVVILIDLLLLPSTSFLFNGSKVMLAPLTMDLFVEVVVKLIGDDLMKLCTSPFKSVSYNRSIFVIQQQMYYRSVS